MPRIWKFWREQPRGESPDQRDARLQAERAALADDYRFVFATEPGQRVLADILRRGGIMTDTYDAHPPNAAYAQGKRRLALEIVEMINADPAGRDRLALTGATESLFEDR
jgi:hypothetical protein